VIVQNWRNGTEYPSATLTVTNPTRTGLRLNPALCGATLSLGMAVTALEVSLRPREDL